MTVFEIVDVPPTVVLDGSWCPAMNVMAAPDVAKRYGGVPYLPGLDGLRALAVVAVMVYHANPAWLPGGFLGVEVFFVISGYLITLLLIGEHERTGTVRLAAVLRAAGPPPAAGAVHDAGRCSPTYTAVFRRDALGPAPRRRHGRRSRTCRTGTRSGSARATRRRVTSPRCATSGASPSRSSSTSLWPLVMVGLLRLGPSTLDVGCGCSVARVAITAVVAALYHVGPDRHVRRHARRATGRSAVAASRRPTCCTCRRRHAPAVCCSAPRWRWCGVRGADARADARRGRLLDVRRRRSGSAALGGRWPGTLLVQTPDGADPWLFRGGFLAIGVATVAVIAAVTHRGVGRGRAARQRRCSSGSAPAATGCTCSTGRSTKAIRRVAGNTLSVPQFVVADGGHGRRRRALVPVGRDADQARRTAALASVPASGGGRRRSG